MLETLHKWIKEPSNIVAAALMIVSTAVILAVSFTSDAPTPDARPSLPVCAHEDGSGQSACYWDASEFGSDHPDAYVFDHGKITFYPHTGELAVWNDKINDVEVFKITDAR